MVPSSVRWTEQPKTPMKDPPPLTRLEQRIKNRQEQKWLFIQEIKQAYQKGKNISRLAKEYELDRRTVRKYINMSGPPSFTRKRKKTVNPYYDQIFKLEQEGDTVKKFIVSSRNRITREPFHLCAQLRNLYAKSESIICHKKTLFVFRTRN
ncbi:hypothetical protein A4244_19000 [Bacillus badius]|nr:hypothetical protein A4244_19000 [Bacillus badius]OCS84868.1 hypothetical protein A6M11_19015 [Bacillus badius]OVE46206.1 hypothetical protein B1A98_19710 [Bacillus badius]